MKMIHFVEENLILQIYIKSDVCLMIRIRLIQFCPKKDWWRSFSDPRQRFHFYLFFSAFGFAKSKKKTKKTEMIRNHTVWQEAITPRLYYNIHIISSEWFIWMAFQIYPYKLKEHSKLFCVPACGEQGPESRYCKPFSVIWICSMLFEQSEIIHKKFTWTNVTTICLIWIRLIVLAVSSSCSCFRKRSFSINRSCPKKNIHIKYFVQKRRHQHAVTI